MTWDYYTRQFEKFSFRDRGGIKIPKGVRELNYQMSVDIIIETITAEKYSSNYVYPEKTHYGFATLVYQDCASLEIPVHQARQRIYEGRVEDAFVQWSNLINIALFHCAWYKHLLLAIEKGNVEEYPQFSPMHTEWKELPLLEVLYEPVRHSQWRFEVEMTQPSSFADCLGFVQNGKSKQSDSPKDNGLPPDGTQPRRNDPSDPFANTNPPDSALGTPWNDPNVSNGNYNNTDPSNNPVNPNPRPIRIRVTWKQTCSPQYPDLINAWTGAAGLEGDTFTPILVGHNGCNGSDGEWYMFNDRTRVNVSPFSGAIWSLIPPLITGIEVI